MDADTEESVGVLVKRVKYTLKINQLIRVAGFEPATHCSQSNCAAKLRYTRFEWWITRHHHRVSASL